MSQTSREQLAKAIQDNRGNTNDTREAILTIFKGLPAMQKTHAEHCPARISDLNRTRYCDCNQEAANAKIVQILAELGEQDQ